MTRRWVAGLLVGAGVASAVAQPVTNFVSEDTWIVGLGSTTPQGSDTRLGICPAAFYWIYLKFDLSGLAGSVLDAELRMTRFDGDRPEEIAVYLIEDDSWSESTLTGPTRPAPILPPPGDALATGQSAGAYDRWQSIALSAAIAGEARGDATVSLMIREDPGTPVDVRNYFSKEAPEPASSMPQLVLTLDPETVATNWLVADVGSGTKPSFDFDASGRIHVMGMTETPGGVVWHAVADAMFGPWSTQTVATGYFYGPGDLRVDPTGSAHMAWHDHSLENPVHGRVTATGQVDTFVIDTPGTHDGWDSGLTISPSGTVHQSSINPLNFGASESLQYGSFDGSNWSYEVGVPGSGPTMYGFNTALAIDTIGNPHIAYCRATDWTSPGELMYACRTVGTWQVSCVVSGGIRGRFPSLALDHWDRPHVAWLDIDSGDTSVGYVRYSVLNAGEWTVEDVDTLSNVKLGFPDARKSVSLLLDDAWRPHVAYGDERTIKYAEKPFATWDITSVLAHSEAAYKSLVVLRRDLSGRPGIVFWQPDGGGLIRLARPRQTSFTIARVMRAATPQRVVVDWEPGIDGYRYTVQRRDSLLTGEWANASGTWPIPGTVWTNQATAVPFRAYRVLATDVP